LNYLVVGTDVLQCIPICHRDHKLWLNQFTACDLYQVHTPVVIKEKIVLTKW